MYMIPALTLIEGMSQSNAKSFPSAHTSRGGMSVGNDNDHDEEA